MVAPSRSNRTAFRRAVFASVALHLALAVAAIIFLHSRPVPPSAVPGIDTSADVIVHQFDVSDLHEIPTGPPEPSRSPPAPTSESKTSPSVESGLTPRIDHLPRTLPAEMLAVISRSVGTQRVVSAAPATPVPPIHGALNVRQTIVYVLDCSGSMGEYGKFARAEAALLSTLRSQPEGVQFQVIVYNSIARPLFPGVGSVPATRLNIDAADARIARHETKGRSNHVEAVRRAAASRPDVILVLTDADDLSLASFRPVLAEAGKPIAICVAKVSAASVGTPQQLR
jgi:hypothetical protein